MIPPGQNTRIQEPYDEAYRSQFHFTYRRGWLSDINGLVCYDGEYHFFSQHCPATAECDYLSTHWGHAVSEDLIHWRELPPAIAPDDENGPAFSGSAVVDWHNTSGFQTGARPPLVAFYTGARYMLPGKQDGVICAAYSNDRGRTWIQYAGNPVLGAITHYNRDPKVFWHEPTARWIMAITLSCADHWLANRDGDYRFVLLSSPDLKHWTEESRFDMPRGLDCPDLFDMPVDGDPADTRWVFWAGDSTHAIGAFDGRTFTWEGAIQLPPIIWDRNGAPGYAAQTFNDIPAADGRRIQISWLRHGRYPGMPFSQQALFPCELTLRTTPGGIRLFREPIREIEGLYRGTWRWQNEPLTGGGKAIGGPGGELLDVRAEIEPGDIATVDLEVRGIAVTYEARAQVLCCQNAVVALAPVRNRIKLRILVDRTSLEIFANNGCAAMAFGCLPQVDDRAVLISAEGGAGRLIDLTVHELRSIWRSEQS